VGPRRFFQKSEMPMKDASFHSLLDMLALEVATLDRPDARAIKQLLSLFERLSAALGDGATPDDVASIEACAKGLRAMQKKGAKNVEAHARAVSESFTALQERLLAPDDPGRGSSRPSGAFELPAWVDEKVFHEFLGQQKAVLEEIEGDILSLDEAGEKAIASLKRHFHTMKGEAGVLGLDALEKACHAVEGFIETALPSPARTDRLLQFKDWVAKVLQAHIDPAVQAAPIDEMLAALKAPLFAADGPPPPQAAAPEAVVWDEEMISTFSDFFQESDEGLAQADQILMAAERTAVEPESVNGLFRTFHTIKGLAGFLDLKEIAALAHTTETMLNQVRQGQLTLEGPVLDLTFDSTGLMRKMLRSARTAVERREAFPTTADLPAHVEKLNAAIQGRELPRAPVPIAAPGQRLGEILVAPPLSIPAEAIASALEEQKLSGRPLGEELIALGAAEPKQIGQALRAQTMAEADGHSNAKIKETVKVDVDRVDNLVEMIGELVIVESMVVNAEEIASISSLKVRNCLSQLGRLTRDLQDVGMRMRMVPLRGVFQKMARLVRDLSRKKGVQITFLVSGEGTEMDRSMVEQISDPLVHMIRNAVDHGIESADGRLRAGKPAHGEVRLSAYHEAGSIVVELCDDGAGLNKEAILKKAIEQKLISESDKLTENEIHNLIFVPGFSTARQVTEISGRGVGMDVVRRNIEAVRGRMSISSIPGRGTTFKMVLPLTLAIIDGMLISCGNERYIVPTLSVVESIVLQPGMFFSLTGDHEVINVRGDVLPLLRLDQLFNTRGAKTKLQDGLVVIVEGVGTRFGLFVDDVLTQQQVVIKTLGSGMNQTKLISGAAILSDGRVGLILNVDEIGSLIEKSTARSAQVAQARSRTDATADAATA
jgi:two-component system, chemotaxis family, sensor kinase CheA